MKAKLLTSMKYEELQTKYFKNTTRNTSISISFSEKESETFTEIIYICRGFRNSEYLHIIFYP